VTDRLREGAGRRIGVSLAMLACATFMLSTCTPSETLTSAGTTLALGTWGGNNVAVIASDSLTHVHVGCTYGDFPGGVTLDANGRFAIDGSYMLHAYPIAVGPSMPAQLSGQVVGGTLTFAVAVNDTVAKQVVSLGPGTVVFGQEPIMGACPVCRVPGLDRLPLIKPSRGPHVDPSRQAHR
jgi:hypothetical protein